MGTPFVGRRRELGEVRARLDDALEGRGSVVLIHGEPGIGKTRLAAEVCRDAHARGAVVAWGRCWDGDGAPAYWPFTQLARTEPIARAADEVDGARGSLGPLLGLTDPAAPAEPQAGRFALFDALTRVLQHATRRSPLVIVFDDLHWSDRPSLLLLKFVARHLGSARLLMVGTFRDTELAAEDRTILADVGREGLLIALGGLSPSDLRELAGDHTPAHIVARLHATTGGNPFFADEVLRQQRMAPREDGVWPVPIGVREALRRRLNKLPEPVRSLLTVAAVLGRASDAALLAEVAEQPVEVVLAALETATYAGLLRSLHEGRFELSHDLVRETLYGDLHAGERARLHARAGLVLDRAQNGDVAAHLAEVARHHLAALPLGDAVRAAELTAEAGRQAARRYAFEPAATQLLRAIELRAQHEPIDHRVMAEWLLELADAQINLGEVRSGQASCQRAADHARALDAPDLLARAALLYGAEIAFGHVDAYHVALLESARAAVGRSDPGLTARLMARLAAAMQPCLTPEVPIALARDAIALARELNEPSTLVEVLAAARAAFRVLDDLDERVAIDAETVHLAEASGNRLLAAQAHRRQVHNLLERGDVTLADEHIDAFERASEGAPRAQATFQRLQLRAAREALSGRFDAALALTGEAERAFKEASEPVAVPLVVHRFQLQHMMFERAWGRRDAIAALLEHRWGALDVLIRADLTARLGRLEEARALFEQAASRGLPDTLHFVGRVLLGEVCLALEDTAHAPRLLELLRPLVGRNVVWGTALAACDGPAARVVGGLAALVGAWDEAERLFEAASAMCLRLGSPPWLARTRLDWARMLERRGDRVDEERALGLRAQAAATFERLGMELFLERARGQAPGLDDARGPGAAAPSRTAPSAARHACVPTLTREGDFWTLADQGAPVRLRDSNGLRYLDHLLRHPDVEFHATDLLALGRNPVAPGSLPRGGTGPLLDAHAKDAYRRRLLDLRETVEDATRACDLGRAERARAELDALERELSRAVGLSGRDREASSAAERARVNVTQRIRATLKRIAAYEPALAHDLTACIHTGTFCRYSPRPAKA